MISACSRKYFKLFCKASTNISLFKWIDQSSTGTFEVCKCFPRFDKNQWAGLCKSTLLSHPCIWSHSALVLRYMQSMVLRTDDWWRDIDDVFHLLGDFWIAFWRCLLQSLSLPTSVTLIKLFQSLKQKQSFDSIVTSRPQQEWIKYMMHYLTNL